MKAVLLFLCIVASNTVSATARNITLGTTSTPSSTSSPTKLSLDGNCGKTVSVNSIPATYHAYNRSDYSSDCTVHFQRADQGKIQVTARLELRTSVCRVHVMNGNNRTSLINGPGITPHSHARSTITSGASGTLSVIVQGLLCAYGNLSISVREACPAFASFPCDNDKCLPQSEACDGVDNCGDNSDESHCPHCPEFTCTNGNCVYQDEVCNKVDNCYDNSDEAGCTCPEFTCTNGKCTPWAYKCDGTNDCGDDSDEANCHANCPEFTCNNGYCVPRSDRCDGYNDCHDGSDEANCPTTCLEFTCNNGHCTPWSYKCDGANDCGDNSDEAGCPANCPEFTCTSGKCIPWSYKCDGDNDCPDGIDEANCPSTCPAFTCANGHCVVWSDVCDDYDDCDDGSDESGCTTFYWSGGAYAGLSIGVFSFFSIATGLFFYRRRRMSLAGSRILIPAGQATVVQSRW